MRFKLSHIRYPIIAIFVTEISSFVHALISSKWLSGGMVGFPFPYSSSTGILGFNSGDFYIGVYLLDILIWLIIVVTIKLSVTKLKHQR